MQEKSHLGAGQGPHRHRTRSRGERRPAAQELEGELLRHMVETHTDPSKDLAQVDRELREARRTALLAATEAGFELAAVAVSPLGPRNLP